MNRIVPVGLLAATALTFIGFALAQSAPQATVAPAGVRAAPRVPAELNLSTLAGDIDSPVHLEGGVDCNSPATIPRLPIWLYGTTAVGHGDHYDVSCPRYGPGSPDATYVYSPPVTMHASISLCNPGTDFDTKLYVYRGTCTSGSPLACNDDACPGHTSLIPDVLLTQGSRYYIIVDGYNGAMGNYEMTIAPVPPPPPACPPGSLFSQTPDPQGIAGVSDAEAGYLRYETYTTTGPVTALRFWGCTLTYDGVWSVCRSDPKRFEIKFYEDANGLPGTVDCNAIVDVSPANSWLMYGIYPVYQYDVSLSTPCNLTSGWISVQGQNDPNCWFLWMAGTGGDGQSWVDDGFGLSPVGYDLSLCLAPQATFGACCLAGAACEVHTEAECQLLGGTYQGDGTTCDPNPCGGGLTGACCVPDHSCVILTQQQCAVLLRGDLNCDGSVNFGDINPFVQILADPAGWQAAYPNCVAANGDANGDGRVDFGDINGFVELLAGGQQLNGTWLGAGTTCNQCP